MRVRGRSLRRRLHGAGIEIQRRRKILDKEEVNSYERDEEREREMEEETSSVGCAMS